MTSSVSEMKPPTWATEDVIGLSPQVAVMNDTWQWRNDEQNLFKPHYAHRKSHVKSHGIEPYASVMRRQRPAAWVMEGQFFLLRN
jgi:hypothetical protein